MEATLNVRMQAPLKERGDKVLRENGISTSQAVRALWKELADTRQLPSFMQQSAQESDRARAKLSALGQLTGVAAGPLSHLTDEELAAVGDARYE